MLGPRVLEHDGLRRLGDRGGKVGHGDRLGVDLGLADRDQVLGKIPQPEFVEVGGAFAGRDGLKHGIVFHLRMILSENRFGIMRYSRLIAVACLMTSGEIVSESVISF